VLVDGGSLDGQQEVAEVLAHPLDRCRPGPAQQPFLGGGLDGGDLVGAPPAGLGEGDQDLAAVARVDVAPDPPAALEPRHPVGDRAGGVIRQVWDVTARGGVRVDGTYYRVSGAKRGPAPAHPVSIWVGAYKPRMLRLTGRLADGWLPSLSYLEPGQLS
jgi:hypothetical protein